MRNPEVPSANPTKGSLQENLIKGWTMEIANDTAVVLEYTVHLEDGFCVKGENGPVSMNFVVGYNQVLPALERRLLGLLPGDAVEFVIPACEAFGDYDPSQLRKSTYDELPQGRKLEVGKWAVATNEKTGARYNYYVKEKDEDSVTLDFNHPLAGKDLYYRVKVMHVRSALAEELDYLKPCRHEGEDSEAEAQ